MRDITCIIVHASATAPDMDIGAAEIRKWHTAKPPSGNGWNDIGYHYVIRRSGKIENGRPVELIGAHTKYHNNDSIGICLIGGIESNSNNKAEANFTLSQYVALDHLIADLQHDYGPLKLFGHRDFAKKECPCFNVRALLQRKIVGHK